MVVHSIFYFLLISPEIQIFLKIFSKIIISIYPKIIWSDYLNIKPNSADISDILEEIYEEMNIGRLSKYNPLRTFSSGDFLELIIIHTKGATRMILRCMPVGWKLLKLEVT